MTKREELMTKTKEDMRSASLRGSPSARTSEERVYEPLGMVTPDDLAALLEHMAEHPREGRGARRGYLKGAQLIRAHLLPREKTDLERDLSLAPATFIERASQEEGSSSPSAAPPDTPRVTVTDEMVERACEAGALLVNDEYPWADYPEDERKEGREFVRHLLTAALTPSHTEGDGG